MPLGLPPPQDCMREDRSRVLGEGGGEAPEVLVLLLGVLWPVASSPEAVCVGAALREGLCPAVSSSLL